jgi:D-alanine-D-alanine ligase
MIKVLVLAGGNSSERAVSLRSGRVVEASLREAGFDTYFIDPVEPLENYLDEFKEVDVVFPALHGHGGEDGILQEYLESIGVTFVGSGSASSKLCFDKSEYLDLMKANGILIPETEVVTKIQFKNSELIKSPFVLKPLDEGSSIDTILVKDLSKINEKRVDEVFANHPTMLLEPFIDGHEITVGVLGNKALPVVEIIPPVHEDFDYENKYNGKTLEICPPKNVSQEVQQIARELTERIHALCNCAHMSRTDMIVSSDNSIYILETNVIPGLTDQSLLPKAAAADGLSMPEVCTRLVEMALSKA